MKIKVCGMNHNPGAVSSLQPDYLGFIFWEPSPRAFKGTRLPDLPKGVLPVGVFVDAPREDILKKVRHFRLGGVQLHGTETPAFCRDLRQALQQQSPDTLLIKAFSVGISFSFEALEPYTSACDYFLFDTKGPLPGGNGRAFDWGLLVGYPHKKPFFLSGGIGEADCQKLLAFLQSRNSKYCHAIDVNSKFETRPGEKDIRALRRFLNCPIWQGRMHNLKPNKMSDVKMERSYHADAEGFYGPFGGAFIPEMLYPNVAELKSRYVEITESPGFQREFRDLLRDYVGRPTPLYFAGRLSEKYGTRIYLKREDLCHTGAHKVNNTVGQILLAKRLGKKRIIAETGAGQHGVATATVCALVGLPCVVYMGEVDIARQAPNVARMKLLGAEVRAAKSGSRTLKDATNEAIRDWINNPEDTHYIIGSVVGPHPYPDMVARFQAVISEEIRTQLQEKEGRDAPDHLIACVGGGSNAAGTYYHYLDREEVGIIAVEAAGKGILTGESAATTALGKEGIIHGSKTLLMQTGDGQITEPYSISAGLDYPGIGPMHAYLYTSGRGEFHSITDAEAMEAGRELAALEGIIPAIETSHAFAVLKKRTFRQEEVLVINLSGRGDKDLQTYIDYFDL